MFEHQINEMGNGCICKTFGCKEWKKQFVKPGEEKRCPRCWTIGTLYEEEWGKLTPWCSNCQLPLS